MTRASGSRRRSGRRSPGRWGAERAVRAGSDRVSGPVAEAEERLMITQAPKASAADERPVRRRESG